MQILNIGPLELILVFILMIVILGPDDMVNIARRMGRTVYHITHSELFRTIVQTARDIRQIPGKFIEEAGLDETFEELKTEAAEISQEMKDMGVDEAFEEVKETATEVSHELDEASQQLAKSSTVEKESQSTAEPSSVTLPQSSPSSQKITEHEIKPAASTSSQEQAKKVQEKQPQPVQPVASPIPTKQTPSLLPSLKLSFTETSFNNDFEFSEKVSIQTLIKTKPDTITILEPTESLSFADDEFVHAN